jgi:hypothetical protein
MPEVKLLITFSNGEVNVQGPLGEKLLCYGLLEMAKDAIRKHEETAARLVQPATVVPFGRG